MRVLVTGGSGDIGSEICRQLASEGHEVAIHFHRAKKRANALAKDLGGMAVQADMSKKPEVHRMVQGLLKKWGLLLRDRLKSMSRRLQDTPKSRQED